MIPVERVIPVQAGASFMVVGLSQRDEVRSQQSVLLLVRSELQTEETVDGPEMGPACFLVQARFHFRKTLKQRSPDVKESQADFKLTVLSYI